MKKILSIILLALIAISCFVLSLSAIEGQDEETLTYTIHYNYEQGESFETGHDECCSCATLGCANGGDGCSKCYFEHGYEDGYYDYYLQFVEWFVSNKDYLDEGTSFDTLYYFDNATNGASTIDGAIENEALESDEYKDYTVTLEQEVIDEFLSSPEYVALVEAHIQSYLSSNEHEEAINNAFSAGASAGADNARDDALDEINNSNSSANNSYLAGYNDGTADGFDVGYQNGYEQGEEDGRAAGAEQAVMDIDEEYDLGNEGDGTGGSSGGSAGTGNNNNNGNDNDDNDNSENDNAPFVDEEENESTSDKVVKALKVVLGVLAGVLAVAIVFYAVKKLIKNRRK